MKPIILVGTGTITLSLILYSLGMISALKKQLITKKIVLLLTTGLVFEVIAVSCMAIGSTQPITTPHGLIGLAGVLIMISIVLLSWDSIKSHPESSPLTGRLYYYYMLAYVFWVIAYFTGAFVGMSNT